MPDWSCGDWKAGCPGDSGKRRRALQEESSHPDGTSQDSVQMEPEGELRAATGVIASHREPCCW
ncbi:unnamed protein product, partial [Rangifer tarandus platyrhynchus]